MFKYHPIWKKLYTDIKSGTWPEEVPLEADFYFLPKYMQERFLEVGYDPNWSGIQRWHTPGPNKYSVFFSEECDGGGRLYSADYVENIKKRYPGRKFHRCYEWCAGPGFIGYTLLDYDICSSLCLTDIHNPALEWAEETKQYPKNDLKDKVDIYLLKDLALLPKEEKFDLVVSNPPHSNNLCANDLSHNLNRIVTDYGWNSHYNFYKNIKNHLTPDGVIMMLENHGGSTVEDFLPMIEEAGLTVKDTWNSEKIYCDSDNEWDQDTPDKNEPINKIYYLEIMHKD
jgi:hypothetical protein